MNEDNNRMTPINLQLFAEPEGGESGAAAESAASRESAQEPAQTTQIDESAIRAIMQQMLNEQQERARRAEARHRREPAREVAQTESEDRTAELMRQLQEETARANRLELVAELNTRGLPAEFADLIDVGEDMDEARERIGQLDTAFKRAVEAAVKARLAGKGAPAGSTGRPAKKAMTYDEIFRIRDAKERQRAIEENPELFVKKG